MSWNSMLKSLTIFMEKEWDLHFLSILNRLNKAKAVTEKIGNLNQVNSLSNFKQHWAYIFWI